MRKYTNFTRVVVGSAHARQSLTYKEAHTYVPLTTYGYYIQYAHASHFHVRHAYLHTSTHTFATHSTLQTIRAYSHSISQIKFISPIRANKLDTRFPFVRTYTHTGVLLVWHQFVSLHSCVLLWPCVQCTTVFATLQSVRQRRK